MLRACSLTLWVLGLVRVTYACNGDGFPGIVGDEYSESDP